MRPCRGDLPARGIPSRPAPRPGGSLRQGAFGATTFSPSKERPHGLCIPSAGTPGLTLYCQCCDYATLPRRSPCPGHSIAAALRRSSGSRLSRACRGEPVEGEAALTGQDPLRWAVPTLHLSKRGRHQRPGGLRRKAHPEPLPSFADRKDLRTFYAPPLQSRASLDTINGATMQLCEADHPASGSVPSRLESLVVGRAHPTRPASPRFPPPPARRLRCE